jgi:hypothetical protein
VCDTSLANVTAELIWISGGMLAEIDNVVDTLKPQFYSSFVTTPDTAAQAATGRALSSTSSGGSASPPKAGAAVKARTPVLAAYAHAMRTEIDAVVVPVTAASDAFLEAYDAKLAALLNQYGLVGAVGVAGGGSSGANSAKPSQRAAASATATRLAAAPGAAAPSADEVVERRAVGVGAWPSSLVAMAAAACGVALEARRKRAHYSEL